jgi:hypothetical protein
MRLERVANGAPRFVFHSGTITQIQINKAFVFFEGARNCKDLSVTDLKVAGKA